MPRCLSPGLKALPLFLVIAATLSAPMHAAAAAGLTNRSWHLQKSTPVVTTDYSGAFTITASGTLGSVKILICSNSPLVDDNCTTPPGLDFTNAQLTAQTGITDFSLFVVDVNQVLLSRTPSPVTAPQTFGFNLGTVINPSNIGSYYVRVTGYASTNASGSPIFEGGLAYPVTADLSISSYVPPFLTFCSALTIAPNTCSTANGDQIDFGDLGTAKAKAATSQLLVATNAPNGYVIQVYGTTLTSGNNIIPAISNGAGSSPGSSQFGLNLKANTNPLVGQEADGPGTGQAAPGYNSQNHFNFVSNDVIASSLTTSDYRRYTISYIVNAAANQAPGIYSSTLTYVCAGSF